MKHSFTIIFSHPQILNGFSFKLTNEYLRTSEDVEPTSILLVNDYRNETELDMASVNRKAFANLVYAFCKLSGYNPDMNFIKALSQVTFKASPYKIDDSTSNYLREWFRLQDLVVSYSSYRTYDALFRILEASFNMVPVRQIHLQGYGSDIDGNFTVLSPEVFYSSPQDFSEIFNSYAVSFPEEGGVI